MSMALNETIWKTCELLINEKNLITIKNIKIKLYNLGYSYKTLNELEQEIISIVNKWRVAKLNNDCNNKDDFNIYKTLAIPKQKQKTNLTAMEKKIFHLECELNKYKNANCRANQRTKLLEKKLHTLINNIKQERQQLICEIKNMLISK